MKSVLLANASMSVVTASVPTKANTVVTVRKFEATTYPTTSMNAALLVPAATMALEPAVPIFKDLAAKVGCHSQF